jgi:SMC interacting uncharacterized protein involved in chromosome segregation
MAHLSLTENILAIVTAAGGVSGLTAMLTLRLKQREAKETATKYMVDTAKSLTETSLSLLEPVRAGLVVAEGKVGMLQAQVKNLESIIDGLTESLEAVTARSNAERDQLQHQLDAVNAEREKLASELELRVAELEALRQQAQGADAA